MVNENQEREELLCRLAARGDTLSWAELVRDNHQRVYAFVNWRLGGNQASTDDLVQEAWLVAVRRLDSFDPAKGTFGNWVRGIANGLIRNHLRQKMVQHKRVISLVADGLASKEPIDSSEDERVAWVLAELDDRHEAVLRAKYLDELTVAQIAQQWQVSAKAIESLLTRARQAFRVLYDQAKQQD